MSVKKTEDSLTVVRDAGGDTGASARRARLRVVAGPDRGQEFGLDKHRCVIGRRNADVVLHDPRVSRQHAIIEIYKDRILLKDLGSSNGTQVNGRRVEVEMLAAGSRILIGDSTLELLLEP
jgi:pSer/pThr/pTyr-binding forkhead associated (FHA) protein